MSQQRRKPQTTDATKASATVIMIPKHLRAEWMDVMALDTMLSNFAFRLGCVVGTYLNNYSGDTFVSQETIALVMGVSERTVWSGFAELEKFGYLIVKRGAVALPAGRKRRSGGQGVANVYVPAFDNTQISAGYRSDKFAKYCGLIWESHLVNPQKGDRKYAKNCGPTLSDPSDQNSSPAKGPSSTDVLGPVGERIRRIIGDAAYWSWFGSVAVVSIADGIVTISAPRPYQRTRIAQDFEIVMLRSWQAEDPTIQRIAVVAPEASQ